MRTFRAKMEQLQQLYPNLPIMERFDELKAIGMTEWEVWDELSDWLYSDHRGAYSFATNIMIS